MLTSLLCASALLAQVPETAAPKLIPELREAVAGAAADARFRVYAVLSERIEPTALGADVARLGRGERQREAARRLRAHADATQAGLRSVLGGLEADGQVSAVRQLWIANSVVFEGTAEAIGRIAELPEVAYVGWDPVRDPSLYQDVPCVQGGGFTTFFTEDFEGGSLPGGWQTATTGCGSVSVTQAFGPQAGSYHLVMAADTDNCDSTASFGFVADLSAATTAWIRFGFIEYSDETDPEDVFEVSDDGVTWTAVAPLVGSDSYVYRTYPLDSLVALDSDVYFRWSWKDNFTPETDGFGIDNIEIADGFEPPPPPTPGANLVGLQATDMWELGFTGQDILLVNIDDGTDLFHPDLVNRIWTNPNDPVDGIDNDGNGFIDDVNGWNFADNNNNPSTGSHGTTTAGIMVGDGSSGVALTGMAPGATLAVARIGGESDHWAALQYAISIGADASSSSFSYKWYFSPKPDYHMHRFVAEMVLAAGVVHANSIGNDGSNPGSAPIPFNISAPGVSPSAWLHPSQSQSDGGRTAVVACGGIELDDSPYSFSGHGPAAWEDLTNFDPGYAAPQDTLYWDFPVGGFGGSGQGVIKPDVVTYTNVPSTTFGGGHTSSFGGTSAATPHLGGAFCLLLDCQPEARPRHVAQALMRTAEDLGAPGKDNDFGAGKVQVFDAAKRLAHLVVASDLEPKIGQSVDLELYGEPNGIHLNLWSSMQGPAPTPVGNLFDLAGTIRILDFGVLDASGRRTINVPLPNDSALVGRDIYVQSVADGFAGPFVDYLFSTVETFRISQ